MYDYYAFKETENIIRNIADSRSLRAALRGFLCDSAMNWWNKLEDNQRKAIILLDFNPAVVTTMVFFGRDWGFGGSYTDVLELILDKVELLAKEEVTTAWDFDLRSIIAYARQQVQAEQVAREKAAAVAREMGMVNGISALEELLMQNSGEVCHNRNRKKELAKEMRKEFLSDALRYIAQHYNDQPTEEGDE